MIKRNLLLLVLGICTHYYCVGQKYNEDDLRIKLDSLSLRHIGLNNTVQLNVSGLPLYEFIYSLGLENNMNITVDPSLNQAISYNFFDAQVKDILVFIYVNFELEYDFVGNIISVKKRTLQKPKVIPVTSKALDISYNPANDFLSLNLQNDTLWKVLERITKLSDKNFVISPEIRDKQVNAFFQNRPFDQVLEMLVKANGLEINKDKEDYYSLLPAIVESTTAGSSRKTTSSSASKSAKNAATEDFTLIKNGLGNLDVHARNIDMIDILQAAADELNTHFVLHSIVEGKSNLELKNVSFSQLLAHLFQTTKYNFTEKDHLFVIGERKMEGIRATELIRMENRTIENVKTAIPKELLSDLDVSEFLELNGLIVSGGDRAINELKSFLASIDVVVPMIQIDIMLLTSSKSTTVSTNPKAGLGTSPTTTTGGINQTTGMDVQLGASTINALLNAISGFGVLNLGQVTENFFASLSAMETNGVIDIESTPKISTLNGQKASISIGSTTYYQETQVNVSTSVTQQGVIQSKTWTPIEANMSVNIQPFVSADEQITMTIKVSQDDFGVKVDPTSPPNKTTQTFESVVRVKNGEVILLGGLEDKKNNRSGSGVPFLSRIPVIKWFFSGRSSEKSKYKLHILIKPTVTY